MYKRIYVWDRPSALPKDGPIDYHVDDIPGLEVRELPPEDGLAQFRLAQNLQEKQQ